ncbi:hypothetical protein DMB91_08450 [Campylobacter sp. MIT 97-5078]|uniref:hypothetical protein n=1 Tax=Campylobacter sp. MIT 97-5078 TaxID=1548153 RepID=UPI0011607F56|nr:hypothetical protein [Campylobacter sp. MIT 97-5078]TQR23054.1 hypothetical protein DMB91_08450 [Campylobacter sp. MIT 97-5078]
MKLIKLSADSKVLSYEEVKAKYNIPANAKMCELKDSRKAVVVFSDNAEDYESYLKTKVGKYIYIPIFYTYTIAGKQSEAFEALDYDMAKNIKDPFFLKIAGPSGIDIIDPKTCE